MGNIVLSCQTIKDELCLALAETGLDYPVIFVESGLHNYPERLGQRIQAAIDQIENVDNILLAFGYCGNSILGISSPHANLIIPRVDDCISLLLGSFELRRSLSNEVGTYFLTKGWLENEQNLISEYERCIQRHGQERALRAMKLMLNHYRRLMIIDTNTYNLEDIYNKIDDFSHNLNIKYERIDGSSRLLKKLLAGPWDEEFAILQPGESFTMDHMGIKDFSHTQILIG